ncbi:MAG: hypothetical protein GQ527_04525, partial [Bacteroidales bacterium]|nr:hypothetical protein [Bacteroidales bacterium]
INDILLREPFTQIDTIIYDIPEGYSISSLPKPKEITSDFGSYRSTITMQGEQILFVRKQLQFQGVFPPSKFEEFRKYKNSTIKADKATVVLEKL